MEEFVGWPSARASIIGTLDEETSGGCLAELDDRLTTQIVGSLSGKGSTFLKRCDRARRGPASGPWPRETSEEFAGRDAGAEASEVRGLLAFDENTP